MREKERERNKIMEIITEEITRYLWAHELSNSLEKKKKFPIMVDGCRDVYSLSPVVIMTRDFVGQLNVVSSLSPMDLLIGMCTAGL